MLFSINIFKRKEPKKKRVTTIKRKKKRKSPPIENLSSAPNNKASACSNNLMIEVSPFPFGCLTVVKIRLVWFVVLFIVDKRAIKNPIKGSHGFSRVW